MQPSVVFGFTDHSFSQLIFDVGNCLFQTIITYDISTHLHVIHALLMSTIIFHLGSSERSLHQMMRTICSCLHNNILTWHQLRTRTQVNGKTCRWCISGCSTRIAFWRSSGMFACCCLFYGIISACTSD